MKRILVIFFLLIFQLPTFSQQTAGYFTTKLSLNIPESETATTVTIAAYILNNYHTEKTKALAAYSWVTNNIRYDADSMYIINSDRDTSLKITAALKRRKGVCENFAALFSNIMQQCGIACYTVSGYTKQWGVPDKSGHTWCAAKFNSDWFLFDPTWDEGTGLQCRWFMIEPADFIYTHMPFDPLWQLLPFYVSHKAFFEDYYNRKKEFASINFKDSVESYLRQNNLQQLESAAARIVDAGMPNQLVINRLSYIKMQVAIIYEDADRNSYNLAVGLFNEARELYNSFVLYRNDRMLPNKSEEATYEMLNAIYPLLEKICQALDGLSISKNNFQFHPAILQNRVSVFTAKLAVQYKFLDEYFQSPIAERGNLFYR